jgi:hypothetical protein
MSRIPVKTRLPLEAWVAAALVTFLSTLSSLVGETAFSVATNQTPPVSHAPDVVKGSLVEAHCAPPGSDG